MGSGLVGLYLKDVLEDLLFTICSNWLTLGRATPPGSARPQTSKQQNRKYKTWLIQWVLNIRNPTHLCVVLQFSQLF